MNTSKGYDIVHHHPTTLADWFMLINHLDGGIVNSNLRTSSRSYSSNRDVICSAAMATT